MRATRRAYHAGAMTHALPARQTLLADLAHKRSEGASTYRNEIAWREFYADVLWHQPRSSWHDLREQLSGMTYDTPRSPSVLISDW